MASAVLGRGVDGDREHLEWLRAEYGIASSVELRMPEAGADLVKLVVEDGIALAEDQLRAGLRLPFPSVVREVLWRLSLAPAQLTPSAYMILYAVAVMWPELFKEEGRPMLTADEFLYMYHPQKCPEGAWAFRSRGGAGSPVELTKMQTSWREWRKRVVIVAGEGWEGFEEERRDGSLPWPVLRVWGEPSEQAKKSPELHGVHLKRVETAGAWARAQETRRKHWNDPEWILQPRHLEMSLSYRGLDKAGGGGDTVQIRVVAAGSEWAVFSRDEGWAPTEYAECKRKRGGWKR
jgi:hypothetical protein